jgi:RND family efflux transporter MFP subunit
MKWAAVSAPFVCALLLLASGCGKKSDVRAAGTRPAMTVQVQIAQNQRIPETTEYLSVLKSRHSSIINPQVEGPITEIYVKSGDRVKAGDPLLQIDPSKQEATLSSQEAAQAAQLANVQLADVSFERAKKLYEAGVVSKQDFDSAKSTYDAAVAQLKSLQDQVRQQKVQLQYYRVTAPTAGIVGDIPVRVGDTVTVSTLLTTVDEPGALEAYIYVPVERSHELKLGLPVHLLDANGQTIADTHITFVSPQVDTGTQTILAKAAVPNLQNKLRIAQQVRAQITWDVRNGPVIPVLAVSLINGQTFAFVVQKESEGTMARERVLKLGDTIGNDYAVLDGIHAGDHIIVSGSQFLQDGTPVNEQILNSAAAGSAGGTQ